LRQASWVHLIRQTISDWMEDKAPQLGAALAYYAVFSIPPLMLLVISIVGVFYKGDVTGAIAQELGTLVGEQTAQSILELQPSSTESNGMLATLFGGALLIIGATGVFAQLQDAMNTIWEVKPAPNRGFWGTVKDRFVSFTMVSGVAFLLLVSLMLTAAIGAFARWLPAAETLGHILELGISFILITVVFALIFKFLPDVKIAWRDVWIGAGVTAALFVLGKFLIGLYLAKAAVSSSYGAAGAVIVMIVWVYYSAQILFLGAEFTQVYANTFGSRVIAETGHTAPEQ
jgi:membrane protein